MKALLNQVIFAASLLSCAICCTSTSTNRPALAPPSVTVPAQFARVYFTVPQSFPMLTESYIVEGTQLLGYVANKQYLALDLAPGKHTLMLLATGNNEALHGDFEAGKTYHFRIFVTPGAFGNRTYWTALENSGADLRARKEEVADCSHVELNPERAQEWVDDNLEDIEEFEEELASGDEKPVTFDARHAL